MKLATGIQVGALILAAAAVILGGCMVYVALSPGASGEFGSLSVLLATLVDVPVGLASLVVGLAVKTGKPSMRWACLALSVLALALPLVTRAAWQTHFIRVK